MQLVEPPNEIETTVSTEEPGRPHWCQPWCRIGTDHVVDGGGCLGDDQLATTELKLYPHYSTAGGGWVPDRVEVYADQEEVGGSVVIHVGRAAVVDELRFTLDEARAHALNILQVVDEVSGPRLTLADVVRLTR